VYDNNEYLKLCEEVQNCELCELSKHKFNHPKTGRKTKLSLEFIKDKCLILWVGQNPNHVDRTDLEKHKLQSFGQKDGEILRKLCGDKLLSYSAFTNLVRCSTDKQIKNEQINFCDVWLKKEFKFIEPKFVIFLGKVAANYFNKNLGDVVDESIFFLPHPGSFKYQNNEAFLNMYKKCVSIIEGKINGLLNI